MFFTIQIRKLEGAKKRKVANIIVIYRNRCNFLWIFGKNFRLIKSIIERYKEKVQIYYQDFD